MEKGVQTILIVPEEEWKYVKDTLQEVVKFLKELPIPAAQKQEIVSPYITAKEFMAAVRICRSNFDKLVKGAKIMTLKKGRKVYVVASEVERYFREVKP